MWNKPLSIADQQAEILVKRFARSTGRVLSDPLVSSLRRNIKRVLARGRRKNKMEAEREQVQPRLFLRKEVRSEQ